jgi:hypothetical protein
MMADSNVSSDRGINLTKTTKRNCLESATITEHGPSNHIDPTRSNPNINASSSAHHFHASSDDMGKLIANKLQLCQQTMQQLANSNNRHNTINYSFLISGEIMSKSATDVDETPSDALGLLTE